MNKSSNSNTLIKLIFIAAALFISALIWKTTQVDNSEEIYVEPKLTIKEKVKPNITTKSKQNITEYDEQEEPQETLLDYSGDIKIPQETKTAYKDYYKFNVYLSNLRTPESLVEALNKFEKNGEFEKAGKVEQKLLQFFPDYDY